MTDIPAGGTVGDYTSFGYLDGDPAAFARFPLAPEAGRVPAYDGGFDEAVIARAEAPE